MEDLELKLPEEVLNQLPAAKEEMIKHLAVYFDGILEKYNTRFQTRVGGFMGSPLSRYEKSMLMDFLIDLAIGQINSLPK